MDGNGLLIRSSCMLHKERQQMGKNFGLKSGQKDITLWEDKGSS